MLRLYKCFLFQQVEKAAEVKAYTQLFYMKMLNYFPKIQQWKSGDPLMRRTAETIEQIFQIISQNILLHKDLYTGKANETETKLENLLKNLNSQLKSHDPV